MGRHAIPAITPAPDTPIDEANLNQARQILSQVQADYGADRDLVNQLLGQAQIAGAFEDFSRTVRISKLAFVKENKLYRQIKGMKVRTGSEIMTGTWEEFCKLLGRSADKVDLDIANLRSFGEEALESMSNMGIGYRELRQYRRLDGDQQLALIEAAKAGDKDAFVDLAEELTSKHNHEKADLQKKLADREADYQAQAEVLSGKSLKIDELSRDLCKVQRRIADMPADEVLQQLRQEVSGHAFTAEAAIRGALASGIKAIVQATPAGEQAAFLHGLILQVERALLEVRNVYNIAAVGGDITPIWSQPTADDAVRQAIEQAARENENGRHE